MRADPPPQDEAPPITVQQIADELGAPRHTVETLAMRLRLGTWGSIVGKRRGYLFTPEEAEHLRVVVKQRIAERQRRAR